MAMTGNAAMSINEMREFAGFSPAEQRYIKRALDIGLGRQDAFKVWARDEIENAAIRRHYIAYQDLQAVRGIVPDENSLDDVAAYVAKLMRIAAFDLGQERIASFSAFRFLYERLLGAQVRPFLPSVFCSAAALPQIRPHQRKVLLQSLSEAAATAPGWSTREPNFYPEFVEEAEAA